MTSTLTPSSGVLRQEQPWFRYAIALVAIGVGVALATNPGGKIIAIGLVLAAATLWSLRSVILGWLVIVTFFDDPGQRPYFDLWESPIQHVANFWHDTLGTSIPGLNIPTSPMLLVGFISVARAATNRTGAGLRRETPQVTLPRWFGTSVLLAFGAIFFFAFYGAITGGDVQQTYHQIKGMMIGLTLVASTPVVATPAFVDLFWRVMFAIAIYRAFLAIYVFMSIGRFLPEAPVYVTSHYDTVIWILALIWVISRFVEDPSSRARQALLLTLPIILAALQFNNRRTAWVILGGGVLYLIISATPAVKARLRPVMAVGTPFMFLYLAAGLVGPRHPVLAPAQSVTSVIVQDDASSVTRIIEDFNLFFTMRQTFPLPAGFGKPYTEFIVADDISEFFAQYRFLPHNSLLGLLMMAGPIGVALILAPYVGALFVTHHMRKASTDPVLRTWMAMVVVNWFAFLALLWGDLGLNATLVQSMLGMASGLGIGLWGYYEKQRADADLAPADVAGGV